MRLEPLASRHIDTEVAHKTGDLVPATGVYRVTHAHHRLPHEVLILKDERFPRCAKCSDSVVFRLLRALPDRPEGFSYRLFELPVIDESEVFKTL